MKQVVVAKQKSTRINYANLAQLKEGIENIFDYYSCISYPLIFSPINKKEARAS